MQGCGLSARSAQAPTRAISSRRPRHDHRQLEQTTDTLGETFSSRMRSISSTCSAVGAVLVALAQKVSTVGAVEAHRCHGSWRHEGDGSDEALQIACESMRVVDEDIDTPNGLKRAKVAIDSDD